MLLARRLRPACGLSADLRRWDHHNDIKNGFNRLAPSLDKAYATLIRDLDSRGLLKNTLVMLSSEFKRTPKINRNTGATIGRACSARRRRRHQGGHRRFQCLRLGAGGDPLTVEDLMTTVYHQVGIVADKERCAR